MSIDTTKTVDISLDTTEVTAENTKDITVPASTEVDLQESGTTVEGVKKEYSIVGDGIYASVSADEAPEWLTGLIDAVTGAAIANGQLNYDNLVQDVRNAIDSIDIAKNTYVEQINITPLIDGIVATKLETLNATYEENFATKADLTTAIATSEAAIAQDISDLSVGFGEDLNARITAVQTAYANADSALASDINALESSLDDQEANVAALATATEGLQTYVGVTSSGDPDGTGILSELAVLQKQVDGTVDTYTGMHELLLNDMDGDEDTTELRVDQWPYALWVPMQGTVNPTMTTRTAYKDDVAAQYDIEPHTVYKNTANNTFWEYHPVAAGGWEEITEYEYASRTGTVRDLHVGDAYIRYQYELGQKQYVEAYKFIKNSPDDTAPYMTDSEGYGWAIVTDNAAEAAYIEALNAYALADGKISQFYAWYHPDNTAPYNQIFDEGEATEYTVLGSSFRHWVKHNTLYTKEANHDPSDEFLNQVLAVAVNTNVGTNFHTWATSIASDGYAYGDHNKTGSITAGDVAAFGAIVSGAADLLNDPNGWYHRWESIVRPSLMAQPWFTASIYLQDGWDVNTNVAQGDVVNAYNAVTRDYTIFTHNGESWQQTGPEGIISKSTYFVNLENEVLGPEGHVATSLGQLQIDSEAYADAEGARVEGKFAYDSTVSLNDTYYKSGFGLNTTGITQPSGADGTEENAFDSEFWVNAERFVLKSPTYPDISASFTVTESGLYLATEHTEATRNEPRGAYSSSTQYVRGDVVTFNNSSYTALKTLTNVTPTNDGINWQLLAAQGTSPLLYDWTGNVTWPTSTTSANALVHTFDSTFGGNAVVKLKLYDAEGGVRATLNGGGETSFYRTLGDSTEEWYEVSFDTLQAGTNTLRIWSNTGDGGSVKAIQVGHVGVNGDIYREIYLYSNSVLASDAPILPKGFNTTTGAAQTSAYWSPTPSTPTGNEVTWRTQLTVRQPQGLGAWVAVDSAWSTPVRITGLSGEATDTIYTVSTTAPSTPAASSTTPSGWSTTLPTKVDNIWVSIGTKGQGSSVYTWGAPVLLSEHTANLLLAQKTLPWPTGTGSASTEGGSWGANGSGTEQNRIVKTDPFGGESVVWEAINQDTSSDADGGFVSPTVSIPGTDKLYRFSVFMRQQNNDGTKYFGLYSSSAVRYSGTTTTGNPYFFSSNLPSSNEWYMLVGYLKPYGSSNYTVEDSGIYRVSDGVRVGGVSNFIFNSASDSGLRLRCYQYYNATTPGDTVDFWGPRIDVMDDRAPTINDLLRKSVQGETFKEIFLYANGATAPTLPSLSGSYNSTTGAAEDEDGWTVDPTVFTEGGLYTWRTSLTLKRVSDQTPWTAHDSAWNTAVKVSGNDGSTNRHLGLTFTSNLTLDSSENKVSKSGSNSWDGELRSTTGYTNGATVTFSPNQNTKNFMMGFTTDPTANTSYNTIDYAWYIRSDGNAYIYENGTSRGNLGGAYSAGDIFTINYDGFSIVYLKNGTVIRTLNNVGADKTLYLDSSFYHTGTDLTKYISFGPMGSKGQAGAGFFHGGSYTNVSTDNGTITSRFVTAVGRQPVAGDVFTQEDSDEVVTKRYNGSTWVAPALMINGDMIVDGGISASHLAATNLSGLFVDAGEITAGVLKSSDDKFVIDLNNKTISIET